MENAIRWSRQLADYFAPLNEDDSRGSGVGESRSGNRTESRGDKRSEALGTVRGIARGEIRVLGPAAAPLAKLKGEHRFQFLLKSPRRGALHDALAGALDFCTRKNIPDSAVILDVDPLSLF